MNAGSKTPDLQRHREALGGSRSGVSGRWSWLVTLGVMALAPALGAVAASASPPPRVSRFVAAQVPESVAGAHLRWLLKASTRLPIGDAEPRGHFSKWFLWAPGESPAELNAALLRRAAGRR